MQQPPHHDGISPAVSLAMALFQQAGHAGRWRLSPDELRSLLGSLGITFCDDPTAAPGIHAVAFRVGLHNSREFGMVLRAGFGGIDADLADSNFRTDRAAVCAATDLTGSADFLRLFKRTLVYQQLARSIHSEGRLAPDEQLESLFARLLHFAREAAAGVDSGLFACQALELELRLFDDQVLACTAACEFASPPLGRFPRPIEKIDKLLHPASIGIVGVSATGMNFGRIILRNLVGSGYSKAQLVIIRPGETEIDGIRCVANLQALGHRLDLFIVAIAADAVGSFSCSDGRLGEIWRISTRTLKLCMEDTFTDCPLYEQTHWVGDARNESLLAYPVFGATDIGRRCIQLTAQSLERYPIAGCQTPSGWDVLLPAWSFLWGISTWDYYWYTGDQQFLRDIWPSVIRNLKGAEHCVNEQGLFSGPFWNMFDWTGADQNQKTVLHNSMFLIGAIDATLKEADVLGDTSQAAWLKAFRQRLVTGVNKLWDAKKSAYPDSIRGDGSISPSTCQHTSFLSILYDIVEPGNLASAKKNLLDPPPGMIRLGSPFAALYLFETLEKLGLDETIVQEIYRNYLPMLEAGATTVWESFPSGTTGRDGFPTRSHCHAWSSAPSYFLPRIILGVKATSPAGQAIQLSPRLCNLTWAAGTVATIRGPVSVAWRLTGDKFELTCSAPQGTQVEFVRNDSLAGKTVVFNGARLK